MHNWGFDQDVRTAHFPCPSYSVLTVLILTAKQAIVHISGAETIKTYFDTNTMTGTPLGRSFCGNCGSPVALRTGMQPGKVFIPSGCLDDRALMDLMPMADA